MPAAARAATTFRARLNNPNVAYEYLKEGYPQWMDFVAILKDAKNVENAKLFMNFIMDSENAVMIFDFRSLHRNRDGTAEVGFCGYEREGRPPWI